MTIRWIIALALALAAVDALPASALSAESYSVPDFAPGISIFSVNLNPEKHVVLYYSYETDAGFRSDYYDTTTHRRLYPNDETRLARENADELRSRLRLTQINHPLALSPRGDKRERDLSKNNCLWPYTYTFSLNASDAARRWMIFVRRSKPLTENTYRGCAGAKRMPLTTQYRGAPVWFYEIKGTTYVAPIDTRFLIRASSLTKFFRGRDDMTLVDASRIAPLVAKAARAPAASQQSYVERIEKIVAKQTARQLHHEP